MKLHSKEPTRFSDQETFAWEKCELSKEDGSSLIAVLVIISILFFLIGAVLVGTLTQKKFVQRDINRLKARYTAEAGLYHFLADSSLSLLPETDTLQIQHIDSNLTSTVEAKPFGGFLMVTSKAHVHSREKIIRSLVGEQASPSFDNAVVLGDLHSALYLTGQTSITGNILVGPRGIKEQSFKGNLFKGTVKGTIIQKKESVLPSFKKTFFNREIAYCNSLLKKKPAAATLLDSGRVNLAALDKMPPRAIYYARGDVELTASLKMTLPANLTIVTSGDLTVSGPITYGPFSRFIAGKDLKIEGETTGKHGLFYAEDIQINGQQSLSAQLIANENIKIMGRTHLAYPSIGYAKGIIEENIREGNIEVSESARVDGTLVIPAPDSVVTEDKMKLIIGEQAQVRGGIYNTSQTELHGQVHGSILTSQFYFYESPTAYINWLKDNTINVGKRPENYVTPFGFSKTRKYEVLAWQEI